MPPSGSLFLFDRKVLRYFRKDGHNWRKKKDGKTVKEAHERLKAGSIDVLHCYYAHGEENENFQRRSYWMLEEDLSHIVLVHYRDVKGNRTNFNRLKETEGTIPYYQEAVGIVPNSEVESSMSSNFHPNYSQIPSQTMDTASMNSVHVQASEYEDAESVYNHQASSRFHSFLDSHQPVAGRTDTRFYDPYVHVSHSNNYHGKPSLTAFQLTQTNKDRESNDAGITYEPQKNLDFTSWEDVLEDCDRGVESAQYQPPFTLKQNDTVGLLFDNSFLKKQAFEDQSHAQEKWQGYEGDSSHLVKWSLDQKLHPDLRYDLTSRFDEEVNHNLHPEKQHDHYLLNNQLTDPSKGDHEYVPKPDPENYLTLEGKSVYSSAMRPHLFDGSLAEEGLKKLDSFNRWMSKELGDVDESHTHSSSGAYWDEVEGQNGIDVSSIPSQEQLDTFMLGPSLSHDQLFSIIDFSPNWAYVGSEIKVLITGRFLKSQGHAENCKWSCMFGEVEVPAEVIADGVLHCHAPRYEAGRVPFYVTCSNRLACSEVREFEYRVSHIQDIDTVDNPSSNAIEILDMRFGRLLCLGSSSPASNTNSIADISQLSSKINSLLEEDIEEWDQMLAHNLEEDFFLEKLKEQLLEKLLKEKLRVWLLQKIVEGGKGPSILDKGGQGVLHFASALGYDWALEPTIVAGVSVNFRDVNGWDCTSLGGIFWQRTHSCFPYFIGCSSRSINRSNTRISFRQNAC
ncbi:hypothetical protein ES332_A12G089900v1 [Gossypium tomentosum]|nr:hypothetical protein ES332_A12G089900v1 [Gossypium tomentosum]TYH95200.1 hypothetical protein ES332_A12G089900v1 [Gossypium tomentosum]